MREGWEMNSLNDVCYFENGDRGKNYPSKKHYVSKGFPFVTAANVENGQILNNLNFITEERFNLLSRGKFKKNDFLFCLRGSLGKFGFVQNDLMGGIASSMVIVRTGSSIEDKWLHYYFISDLCQNEIENRKGGAAQPNLGAKDLKKFQIPIPPLPEQKQIVAILDKAFAAIDQAQTNIKKNIENAKELFQSKLNEIFSQKGDGWEEKTIIELCKHKSQIVGGPFGSNLKVKDYRESGVPILRLQNIGKGYFIDKDIKYVTEEKAEKLKYHSFEAGDIVLAKLGIPIGKTCIVPDRFPYGIVVADVVRIRPNKNEINYDFLKHFLNSDNSVKQLTADIRGATRPRVNIAEVRNLKLSVPSIEKQIEIGALIDDLETFRNALIAKYENRFDNLEDLKKSILQKAFSGQLSEP